MLIAVSDSDDGGDIGDIPFATSNEIYTPNVYGCHANIMTHLLPYGCMIFIHMAFRVDGGTIMK